MAAIDIEPLLKPISESAPSGTWLKYEPLYAQIQEARKEDENLGDQGVWTAKQKKADWPLVRRLCTDALKKQSKDLQLAVWLLEAWTTLDGYDGFKAGLDLITRLSADFWDTIFPEIEDGDMEYRTSPINWLNEKYVVKLKALPITSPRNGAPLTLLDRENAMEVDQRIRKNPGIVEELDMSKLITMEKFGQSERDTPDDFYVGLQGALAGIIESIQALETELDSRCGNDAPSFRSVKKLMEEAQTYVNGSLKRRGLGGDAGGGEEEQETTESGGGDYGSSTSGGGGTTGGMMMTGGSQIIQSREAAYDQIRKATGYLKQIEPHSPVPYLIERALKWGRMSLPELLGELIADDTNRCNLFGLLGIKAGGDVSDSGNYDATETDSGGW